MAELIEFSIHNSYAIINSILVKWKMSRPRELKFMINERLRNDKLYILAFEIWNASHKRIFMFRSRIDDLNSFTSTSISWAI